MSVAGPLLGLTGCDKVVQPNLSIQVKVLFQSHNQKDLVLTKKNLRR